MSESLPRLQSATLPRDAYIAFPRTAWRRLPMVLRPALAIVGGFAAIALLLAAIYDAPLMLPTERVSVVLGYSAVLPVAVAIVLYLLLRTLPAKLSGRKSDAFNARVVGTDLTLMALFVVATYFHFSVKTWAHVINPALFDAQYYATDQYFQPIIDWMYRVRSALAPLIPSVDLWYQSAFLLMFMTGFCQLSLTRGRYYPHFCIGVLMMMALGALSYLIAPALGPFIYEDGLNAQATEAQAGMLWAHREVAQHGMDWIREYGSGYFTGALAAMPSLHVAHATVMTYFIARSLSVFLPLYLLLCFWVLIESVASRWHYLIDAPAGLALAALVIWLTHKACDSPQQRQGKAVPAVS